MEGLEAQRKEFESYRSRVKSFNFVFFVAMLAAGIFLGDGHTLYSEDGTAVNGSLFGAMLAFFIAVFVIVAIWQNVTKKEKELKDAFKGGIVAAELRNAFQDVDYQPELAYPDEYMKKLGVFKNFAQTKGEDYVRAKYRGRQVSRCDEKLYVEEKYEDKDSDGNIEIRTGYVRSFAGSAADLELSSPCPARLLICADGMDHASIISKQGWAPDEMPIFGDAATDIFFDTLKFGREYHVNGPDNESARAMLTPRRAECLRKLDVIIPEHFAVLFEGDKLHLIVSGENLLDPDLKERSAPMDEQRERIVSEVGKLTERYDLMLELEKE